MVLLIPVIHGTGVGTEWLVKHLMSGVDAPPKTGSFPRQGSNAVMVGAVSARI